MKINKSDQGASGLWRHLRFHWNRGYGHRLRYAWNRIRWHVYPRLRWAGAYPDHVDRSGPRNLDSGLSEISIVFQAAVPKPVAPKYTTSGVRRPSEL